MTTMQTTQASLAALLEAAPPELREVLTVECECKCHQEAAHGVRQESCVPCGGTTRVTLPVPEATLAAQEWMQENGWLFGWDGRQFYVVLPNLSYFYFEGENAVKGTDIFAAIRAALEAK